ncbi:hypothetical protein [Natronococcus wangiae]|uniref:hypothetical protein n=1 Tax=Natronococcus wangiae TaxID=3068275 RepID=UPI00273D4F65|nr:hypothetical protein [Natronococcus sp. AD5]
MAVLFSVLIVTSGLGGVMDLGGSGTVTASDHEGDDALYYSFEGDMSEWTLSGNAETDTTYASDGDTSLHVWGYADGDSGNAETNPGVIDDGEMFSFSFSQRFSNNDADTTGGKLHVELTDGENHVRFRNTYNADGKLAGSLVENSSTTGDPVRGSWEDIKVEADGESVYLYRDGNLVDTADLTGSLDPEQTQLKVDYDHWSSLSSEEEDIHLDDFAVSSAGADHPSGQVVNQHGDPVSNATVEGWGVAESALNPDAAEPFEEQAQDLRDELTDPIPDEWDNFQDSYEADEGMMDLDEFTSDVDGTYPMVHKKEDWGFGRTTIFSEEVDEPRIHVEEDEELILSLWDPSKDEGGFTDTSPVRSSHPGAPMKGTFVVEKIGPTGETLDSTTYDTQLNVVEGRTIRDDREWHTARAELPRGVYQIHQEDSPEKAVTVVVGDPDELWETFESDLRDEADQLTERAEEIQSRLDQEHLVRQTTQTDANGEFNLEMPDNVVTVDVRAMKADGTALEGVEDPSLEDLREAETSGYDGPFHLPSPVPETVDSSAENVEVTVYQTPSVPVEDIDFFADLQEFLEEERLNETVDDLQTEYNERFDEMERSSLERVYEDHATLVETVPNAEDEYLDRSDFGSIQDAESLSNTELEDETRTMQVALANAQTVEPPKLPEDPADVDDGLLNAEYNIPGGIDSDTVVPEVHYADGSHEKIDEEYWSIESQGGIFSSSDVLVIEDYPVNSEKDFNIRIQAAGEDGHLDDRVPVENPKFEGESPDIESIQFNTLSPGPGEMIYMTVNADENFQQVVDAEVSAPDGQQVNTTVDDDEVSFEAAEQGNHFIRLTIESTTGDQFVVSERLKVKEEGRDDPATIRATSADGEDHAVIGDKLHSARVETSRTSIDIEAIAPQNKVPSDLNINPSEKLTGTDHRLNIDVYEGHDERQAQSNVPLTLHFDSLSDNSLVYVDGHAVTWDGETRYGELQERDNGKVVMYTHTDSDGSVTVDVNEDPSFWDEVKHSFNQKFGKLPYIG